MTGPASGPAATAPWADLLRRAAAPASGALVSGLVSVLLALLAGAGLIALAGVNPLTAYAALLDGALGNRNAVAETLVRAVPLALCGLGIALSFRAGVFNVGAEGQLFVGGMAAGWVGVALAGLPSPALLALMAAAAITAGAAWSGLAACLKLRFQADELITTIMLNYVAIHLVSWLLHGPLQDPASPLAQTARLPAEGRLPVLLPGTRLHAGLLVVLVLVVAAHLLLWRSAWGFRLRVVGLNARAALNAGMNPSRLMLSAFLLCGALAGLAGFAEVAGIQRRMIENLSPGYGYTAIIVALLGRTAPLGVLLAALLFAALQIGATTMESAAGVPSNLTTIVQGLIVLFLIGRTAVPMIRDRMRRGRGQPRSDRAVAP